MDQLSQQGEQILYDRGLLEILNTYGTTVLTGSFNLGTMVKPDIDMLIKIPSYDPYKFFSICPIIAEKVQPYRLKFVDQRLAKWPGPLPSGYFLGLTIKIDDIE